MHDSSSVFVIDDDEAAADSIEALMESEGFSTRVFNSAEQYLSDCDTPTPSCLIVDVRLPRVSGLELQEMLIARDVCIPIIFVSGHADETLKQRALKNGAVDFLEKPFPGAQLTATVRRIIGSS